MEVIDAVSWPDIDIPASNLKGSHQNGCTEPWIAEIVCSLLKARGGSQTVVELGGFMGTTSAWLALALEAMGGGRLWVSEPDEDRAKAIEERLAGLSLHTVLANVDRTPSPQIIDSFGPCTIDFCFVDNDHTKLHVEQEIVRLWPKMTHGGIMCFHDVWGVTDLQSVVRKYGGIALDLPRLGPAGGLGILQIPNV